jgi:hypothetical protein
MQKTISLIYIIAAAAFSIYAGVMQTQPAIFFIDLIAPNAGDEYSLKLVWLVTFLIFLIPLIIFQLISRLLRIKPDEIIGEERTGVYVTRTKALQSGLLGIPIYINSNKVGMVDNGKTKFIDVPFGLFTIQAGKGKQASEIIETRVKMKEKLNFKVYFVEDGLSTKVVLELVDKGVVQTGE